MVNRQGDSLKVVLSIDDSNLFGGISELLGPDEYIDFAALLKAVEKDFSISQVKFYGTYMQIDPSKSVTYRLRLEAQKAFFDSAKNCSKVSFHKGHFSGAGKEKGIDVKLAVDMAVGACRDTYDEAIIMTGDADLKYGVEVARTLGKTIHLAAFGSRFPFGIAPATDKKYVYDLNGFFKKKVLPTYKHAPKNLVIRELGKKVAILSKTKPGGVRRGSK